MLKNTSLAAPEAFAHCLQRRSTCKSQLAARGAQNGPQGLDRWLGGCLQDIIPLHGSILKAGSCLIST